MRIDLSLGLALGEPGEEEEVSLLPSLPVSTVAALELRQGHLGRTLEQGEPPVVQVPSPCGSEMSPPALTHHRHFAFSVFIEPLIFLRLHPQKMFLFGVFSPFFNHSGESCLQNLFSCLLIPAGALQTWVQSCHIPARLSMSLPGLADTQEPGLGSPGDLGELYKHLLLIWGALF